MTGNREMVTVFRTMEMDSKEACETAADALSAAGLSPVILNDKAPGVPSGVCEVRVPADQQERAEQILATPPLPEQAEVGDPASELDLSETIFHSEGSATAEFEAIEIKALLEANKIPAIIVGDSVLPNLPFEVRISKKNAQRARELIEELTAGGPEAAEQAEFENEQQ